MLPGKTYSDYTHVLAASAAISCAGSHSVVTQGEHSVSVSFLLLFMSFILDRGYGFFSDSMCMNRLNLLLEPDHKTPLSKSDSINLEKKKKKQESFR